MNNLNIAKSFLQLAPASVMMLFGVDQLMNPDAWVKFVPSWIPIDHITFMRLHAVCNICLGILLALGWQLQWVLWAVVIWWASIIPFAFLQDWTIAVRDSALLCCIIALIYLVK